MDADTPNYILISGGQTGVDRAVLDVAAELGFASGGWCPKGRRAEDGVIDGRYPLVETSTEKYEERTEWNVRDSDGTLIIHRGELEGGTELTLQLANQTGKPVFTILDDLIDREAFHAWLKLHGIKKLNIAGPRESTSPGIYALSRAVLVKLFGQ